LVFGIRAYQHRHMPKGIAPELVGTDLDGRVVSLADYHGKPVLLHFWATWCGVCKAEQHNIDAVSRDLPVLTVASQSGSAAEVGTFVREHAISPRVIIDEQNVLASRFGVHAFPASFVIDGDGAIRHAEVGYTTELGLRARMWLAGQ
jgi:thiol-disulfide isomerase/thioredoxin